MSSGAIMNLVPVSHSLVVILTISLFALRKMFTAAINWPAFLLAGRLPEQIRSLLL
jgi:hypothetical protein